MRRATDIALWLLAALLAVLVLGGCGSKRTEQSTAATQEKTQETTAEVVKTTKSVLTVDPTTGNLALASREITTVERSVQVDGGRQTDTTRQLEATTQTETHPLLKTAAATAGAVVAGPVGGLFGGGVGGAIQDAITLALAAWAAHKTAQSRERGEQADFHKKDADEAYRRLLPAPSPPAPPA